MTKININETGKFMLIASLFEGQPILAQKGEESISVIVVLIKKDLNDKLIITVIDGNKKKFQGIYNPKKFSLELIRC